MGNHAATSFIATSVGEVVSIPSWERRVCPFGALVIHIRVEIFIETLMLVHDIGAAVRDLLLGQCDELIFLWNDSDLLSVITVNEFFDVLVK